jgi:hypothetical protein
MYASTKSAGTSATTDTGHHGSGEVHHHDDHGHGHHHHHEPELRKTQEWSHHSGIQSKYENQGDDPSIAFMQGKTIYFMKTPRKNDLRLTNFC